MKTKYVIRIGPLDPLRQIFLDPRMANISWTNLFGTAHEISELIICVQNLKKPANLGLDPPLDKYLVYASSDCPDESVHEHRLVWDFAARRCDKCRNLMKVYLNLYILHDVAAPENGHTDSVSEKKTVTRYNVGQSRVNSDSRLIRTATLFFFFFFFLNDWNDN